MLHPKSTWLEFKSQIHRISSVIGRKIFDAP